MTPEGIFIGENSLLRQELPPEVLSLISGNIVSFGVSHLILDCKYQIFPYYFPVDSQIPMKLAEYLNSFYEQDDEWKIEEDTLVFPEYNQDEDIEISEKNLIKFLDLDESVSDCYNIYDDICIHNPHKIYRMLWDTKVLNHSRRTLCHLVLCLPSELISIVGEYILKDNDIITYPRLSLPSRLTPKHY